MAQLFKADEGNIVYKCYNLFLNDDEIILPTLASF